ncbi:hypothetical protein OYE22_12370 [Streptomyces sp. 71268]|uniref:hypothetical protein n=1 Tax=Streptomyces sp. 71268 TaxID=3002640 RepID=UPI0023F87A98|nr:hypothetical protein [Streptomyces sp. 71268]WEV25901.1 hypothetical protein OYE22_12370 [Streptomyces sp. 71268]
MAELVRLELPDAVRGLRRLPDSGLGFLGLDPLTQHDQWLLNRLTSMRATVYDTERGTLVGYAPNPANPRQARVAVAADDSAALTALLDLIRSTAGYTSFTAVACAPDAGLPALLDCGFREVGTLRGHVLRAGVYLDADVYYAADDDLRPHPRTALHG